MQPDRRALYRHLLAWGTVFLAYRLLCLYFFADAAWTPEENFRGTAALEFQRALHGESLKLPFWCYQADEYLGGSLVTAFLTAFINELLGPTLLSLKLAALLFALGALLTGFRWLYLEHGLRVASLFALLYTFAPPYFVFLGALSMGYHTESVFFLALILGLWSSLCRASKTKEFLLLGIVGGFSFWYSNLNAIALMAALFSLPRRSWPGPKYISILVLGFLCGAIFWIAQNLSTDFSAIRHLLSSIGANSSNFVVTKVLTLFTIALPHSLGLPPPYEYLHYALLLGLLGFALKEGRPLRRFFLIYLGVFAVLYGMSSYRIDVAYADPVHFRYLQPLYFLVFACLAVGLHKSWQKCLAGLWIAASIFGVITFARIAPPGRAWQYRSYSYADLSAKAMNSCFKGPSGLAPLLEWINSEPLQSRAMLQVPFNGAYNYEWLRLAPAFPIPLKNRYFEEGFGAFLAENGAPPAELLSHASRLRDQKWFWRGVATGTEAFTLPAEIYAHVPPDWRAMHRSLKENVRLCFAGKALPAGGDEWDTKGQGAAITDCGVTDEGIRIRAEAVGAGLDENGRSWLAWGLGWRLRQRHLSDPLRSFDRIRRLPVWAWAKAREGALYLEQDLGLPETESIRSLQNP